MRRTPKYLYQYPDEMVRIRCDHCHRFGQYQKWKLAKILGSGRELETVLGLIAHRQCRRRDRRLRCLAYFVVPD